MARRRAKRPMPTPGDTFAVPLDGGRFAACRVLATNERGDMVLVAAVGPVGTHAPEIGNPALRTVLPLTHHGWAGRPCAAWVGGPPPEDYAMIGNLPPEAGEADIPQPGTGGWPFFRIQPHEQWLWDHPADVPPPPPPPEGRFVLHRFNGDEVYRLESATMMATESDAGGVTLWFEAKADPEDARRCEDTAEMGMSPNASVGVELPDIDSDALVGREFVVPGTKTDAEDSCMSLLYYCEHEPLRDNRIAVVSRDGDRFRVRWTAVVRDVNYYDGSKPPTRVEIEGEFVFKDAARWAGG